MKPRRVPGEPKPSMFTGCILLFLLVYGAVSSCAKSGHEKSGKRGKSKDSTQNSKKRKIVFDLSPHQNPMGFSIGVPKGWETLPTQPGWQTQTILGQSVEAAIPLMLRRRDEREPNVTVATLALVVEKLSGPKSVETYFAENLRVSQADSESFRIIEKGKVTVNGVESRWMLSRNAMGERTFQILQYFFTRDARGYSLSFGSPPELFDKQRALFEAMANSFRFRDISEKE